METNATLSFLGTGSGIPSAGRFFSSAVLRLDGFHLLVDAGEPCVHLLRDRSPELIQNIEAVVITHGHVDHIGGMPALLQGARLLGRTKPLPIYLPGEMIAPLRAWTSALYLREEKFGFPLVWREWKNAEAEVLGNGISVTPHANRHLEQAFHAAADADPARPCRSYSLEVLKGSFRAVFSGDLAEASELTPLVSSPATLLVSELAHFSASRLGEALRGASLGTLCLVHLSEEYAGDRSELKMQMENLLPQINDVIIPEDGEILDF